MKHILTDWKRKQLQKSLFLRQQIRERSALLTQNLNSLDDFASELDRELAYQFVPVELELQIRKEKLTIKLAQLKERVSCWKDQLALAEEVERLESWGRLA